MANHAVYRGTVVAHLVGWLRNLEVYRGSHVVNFGRMPFFQFRLSLSRA